METPHRGRRKTANGTSSPVRSLRRSEKYAYCVCIHEGEVWARRRLLVIGATLLRVSETGFERRGQHRDARADQWFGIKCKAVVPTRGVSHTRTDSDIVHACIIK